MNREIEDALCMLLHCSLKDKEYTTQKEQYTVIKEYIEKLEKTLNEIKDIVKGYMPTNQSVCKAMDEIEEIIDKVGGNDERS